jgi:peptide/nickel transport system substrate-binding protein
VPFQVKIFNERVKTMKKRQLMVLGLILVIASSLFLVACGEPEETPTTAPTTQTTTQPPTTTPSGDEPVYGGTFKMISTAGITGWDAPTDATSFLGMTIKNIVYEPLLNFDADGNWTPNLASNYEVSPDGLTVTITLKEGIMFHDGTELTSADIKYHIENFTAFGAKMGVSGGFKNVQSVDTPERYVVVLNLSQPNAPLPVALALNDGTINSSTAVQKPTTEENRAKDHVAGAGAFKYVEWVRDVHFKAERFDNYFREGEPYLDAYEVDFYADKVSALLAFENGEGQGIYDITPKDAADLEAKGYQVFTTLFANFVLTPDGANADSPFAKLEVREAVEYAIDKKALAESFGYGYYQPLEQIAEPQYALAYNPTIEPREYDPAKAMELLDQAGYADGVDISLYAQMSDDMELLTAIQSYLADVGFNTKIEVGDPAKFHGEWAATGWHNGVVFRGYGFQPNVLENFTNWWRHPPQGSMFTSLYYPENWDARCDAAISETDPVKRKEMVQELVKTIHDECMSIPIMTNPVIIAFAPNVGGADSYAPLTSHFQSPHGLWLKE